MMTVKGKFLQCEHFNHRKKKECRQVVYSGLLQRVVTFVAKPLFFFVGPFFDTRRSSAFNKPGMKPAKNGSRDKWLQWSAELVKIYNVLLLCFLAGPHRTVPIARWAGRDKTWRKQAFAESFMGRGNYSRAVLHFWSENLAPSVFHQEIQGEKNPLERDY